MEEPPQPKIKLRAPSAQAQQTQPGRPKRITIHVGGGREGSQGSPAPQAAQTNGSVDEVAIGGAARPTPVIPVEAKSNQSITAPGTPAAVMKREDSNRVSPAVPPQPQMSNGYSASAFRPVMPPPVNGWHGQPQPQGIPNGHAIVQQQQQQQPPLQQRQQQLQQPTALFDIKYRCPGASELRSHLQGKCIYANSLKASLRLSSPTSVSGHRWKTIQSGDLSSTYLLPPDWCTNHSPSIFQQPSGSSRSSPV